MKMSHTKLKTSLVLAAISFSLSTWSKPVAQVTDVRGQIFVITAEGKTSTLKLNDHIEDKSEIMVGEEGSITLNDYFDATYHLTAGSHLKIFEKSVQLKKGKTWIQSMNGRHPLALTTANGHVDYWKGEFIALFDQTTSRSQFLVVNGEIEVSNVLDKNMKHTVTAGTFTMIDPEVENGLPRFPTKVGLTSLNDALSGFRVLPAKTDEPTPSRRIASLPETTPKKGEIIFISNGKIMNRLPASVNENKNHSSKKNLMKQKQGLTNAPIRIFGMSSVINTMEIPRQPASISPSNVVTAPQKVAPKLNVDDEFNQTLRMKKDSQPKYSKELESLIQDLTSY